MSKHPLANIAIASSLVILVTGAVAAQTAPPPPTLPAAVMCYAEQDQSWRVGYLHRVNKNGDAIYFAPTGKLSATVDARGVVVAPANQPAVHDCTGKTLDELRSKGRVMDFQRTK